MAWTSVITNAGAALIASWVKGDDPIELTRAAGGDSAVPVASLLAQTALNHEVQEADIVQKKDLDNGQEIKLQFPAHTEAYLLRQIGIFAGETMVAIFQNDSGISIQSETENPNFLFSFYGALAVSGEAEFSVTITADAFVTMDVLENKLLSKTDTDDFLEFCEETEAALSKKADASALSGKADLDAGEVRYSELPVIPADSLKAFIGI